jgi:predicted acetyltransferase
MAAVLVMPARLEEKSILRQLLELYQHDLSPFDGADLDSHGLYNYRYLDHYWTEAGRFPFLFRAAGKLAGFALVRRSSFFLKEVRARQESESGINDSFCASSLPGLPNCMQMAEFCVLRKYRRQGVGRQAARFLFQQFPGRWEVPELQANLEGNAFWRSVIHEFTGGRFEELFLDDERWRGPVQIFGSGYS